MEIEDPTRVEPAVGVQYMVTIEPTITLMMQRNSGLNDHRRPQELIRTYEDVSYVPGLYTVKRDQWYVDEATGAEGSNGWDQWEMSEVIEPSEWFVVVDTTGRPVGSGRIKIDRDWRH